WNAQVSVSQMPQYYSDDNLVMKFHVHNNSRESQRLKSLDKLRIALFNGDENTVAEYLDWEGGDPNAEVVNGFAGLHLASQRGQNGIVEYFVTRNAKVNKRGSSGTRPLLLATQSNHLEVVRTLCRAPELRVNATDSQKNTALMCAADIGSFVITEELVRRG